MSPSWYDMVPAVDGLAGAAAVGSSGAAASRSCVRLEREDGVTLGQCDLNFISVKQMDEIQTVCGIPARLIRPLKINVEYERLFRPIQLRPQITGSYTRFLSCGR